MSKSLHPDRLDIRALAQSGTPMLVSTLLLNMERLAQEAEGLEPDSLVKWEARAEVRTGAAADGDIWLHLAAATSVPLTCQRCLGTVDLPVDVNRWYRFVATEDIAMAEDDASEEDLLVLTPQFDLLAVLEDELLMALPLVPMHDECPDAPVPRAGDDSSAMPATEKPNPFALLAQLKKNDQ